MPARLASSAVRTTTEAPVSKTRSRARPVDPRDDREVAAKSSVNDDAAALPDLRLGRQKLSRHTAQNVGRLIAISVSRHQRDRRRRPNCDRAEYTRDIGAPRPSKKIGEQRDAHRGGGEGMMVETQNRRIRGRQQQRSKRSGEDRQRRDKRCHRTRRLPTCPPRANRERACFRRAPSPDMTSARSSALISDHEAISPGDRPQPMHSSEIGSITQILTQGVAIGAMPFN